MCFNYAHIGQTSVGNHQKHGEFILQPDVTQLYFGCCFHTDDVMGSEIFLESANKKKPGTFLLLAHLIFTTRIPTRIFFHLCKMSKHLQRLSQRERSS